MDRYTHEFVRSILFGELTRQQVDLYGYTTTVISYINFNKINPSKFFSYLFRYHRDIEMCEDFCNAMLTAPIVAELVHKDRMLLHSVANELLTIIKDVAPEHPDMLMFVRYYILRNHRKCADLILRDTPQFTCVRIILTEMVIDFKNTITRQLPHIDMITKLSRQCIQISSPAYIGPCVKTPHEFHTTYPNHPLTHAHRESNRAHANIGSAYDEYQRLAGSKERRNDEIRAARQRDFPSKCNGIDVTWPKGYQLIE